MIVNNGLYPHHLKRGPGNEPLEDGPFIAISLLRFKAMAEYRDEPTATLTGAAAYARYVDALGGCLEAVGARRRAALAGQLSLRVKLRTQAL